MRRAESFPLPLKRDRSFSEHDLAELRGDMLPPLAGSPRLGGEAAVRLRGERPRSQTMTGAFPPPVYRGQYGTSWIIIIIITDYLYCVYCAKNNLEKTFFILSKKYMLWCIYHFCH